MLPETNSSSLKIGRWPRFRKMYSKSSNFLGNRVQWFLGHWVYRKHAEFRSHHIRHQSFMPQINWFWEVKTRHLVLWTPRNALRSGGEGWRVKKMWQKIVVESSWWSFLLEMCVICIPFNLWFMMFWCFFYFGKVLVNAFRQFSLPKPTLSQRCVHFCAQMTWVVLQSP